MALFEDIREYWDADARTYDDSHQDRPRSPRVRAAWTAALGAALPPAPARVLDCGAGTGFLSLVAAMLERLAARATELGLEVETVAGSATEPPASAYDAVMERHLLWTLPDPSAALRAWRSAAPDGRLVLVESLWGEVDAVEWGRGYLRRALHRLRQAPPEHHAEYDPDLRRSLPLGTGTHPSRLVELALEAGWPTPRLRRLSDVEWAERAELELPERLVGVVPRFVIMAGR